MFIVFTIRYLQILAVIYTENVFKHLLSSYFETPLQPDGTFSYNGREFVHFQRKFKWWASINYALGVSCAYSAMYVGAYRFADSFLYHNLVAVGVFVSAPAYLLIDIFFSALMTGSVNSKATATIRHWIGAFMLVSCIVFHIAQVLLFNIPAYHEVFVNPMKRLFWMSTGQPGVVIHLVHSISEWIYLFSLAFYVYSLAPDFARISFDKLQLQYAFITKNEDVEKGSTTPSPRPRSRRVFDDDDLDGGNSTPMSPLTLRSASTNEDDVVVSTRL